MPEQVRILLKKQSNHKIKKKANRVKSTSKRKDLLTLESQASRGISHHLGISVT